MAQRSNLSFFWIHAFSLISFSSPSPFYFSSIPLLSFCLLFFLLSALPPFQQIPLLLQMALLQSLPLCYLPKSLAIEHLSGGAFQGPGKGCLKQREQDLREQRTGICKKGYRQERPGVHPLIQAKSSPTEAADGIIYSTSIWNDWFKKKCISQS